MHMGAVACHSCYHKKETHLQEVNEVKTQKEAGLSNGERNHPNDISEPSDPAVPDTTYSPSFSVHEPINLFQVGFLLLEIDRALASTQGHCKNTVNKRPQNNESREVDKTETGRKESGHSGQ